MFSFLLYYSLACCYVEYEVWGLLSVSLPPWLDNCYIQHPTDHILAISPTRMDLRPIAPSSTVIHFPELKLAEGGALMQWGMGPCAANLPLFMMAIHRCFICTAYHYLKCGVLCPRPLVWRLDFGTSITRVSG